MRAVTFATGVFFCSTFVIAAAALSQAQPSGERAVTFYVGTEGSDAWSGRLSEPNDAGTDGPFASIPRAQEAVRELRGRGELAKPVTVRVRGVHRLSEPIVLMPEDSGTAECPVTFTAYPSEKPVLSGGRVLTGWKKGAGDLSFQSAMNFQAFLGTLFLIRVCVPPYGEPGST